MSTGHTFPLRGMLCDFSYQLGQLIPAPTTSCCVEGADIARRLLILGLFTRFSMSSWVSAVPKRTLIVGLHGGEETGAKMLMSEGISAGKSSMHYHRRHWPGFRGKRGINAVTIGTSVSSSPAMLSKNLK